MNSPETDSVDLIDKYFPLSTKQQNQFKVLGESLITWNDKINLISRKDIRYIYTRHVLHSLAIASVIKFKPDTHILDVGTGGGFPGLPLAILFPESKFRLIDSIAKKISVVRDLTKKIGLQNVHADQIRAEQVTENYHFIVSRAVTRMSRFYEWVDKKVDKRSFNNLKNGILYLKGGNIADEMQEIKKEITVYNLKDHFEEDFFETKLLIHIPM